MLQAGVEKQEAEGAPAVQDMAGRLKIFLFGRVFHRLGEGLPAEQEFFLGASVDSVFDHRDPHLDHRLPNALHGLGAKSEISGNGFED